MGFEELGEALRVQGCFSRDVKSWAGEALGRRELSGEEEREEELGFAHAARGDNDLDMGLKGDGEGNLPFSSDLGDISGGDASAQCLVQLVIQRADHAPRRHHFFPRLPQPPHSFHIPLPHIYITPSPLIILGYKTQLALKNADDMGGEPPYVKQR